MYSNITSMQSKLQQEKKRCRSYELICCKFKSDSSVKSLDTLKACVTVFPFAYLVPF